MTTYLHTVYVYIWFLHCMQPTVQLPVGGKLCLCGIVGYRMHL